MDISNVLTYKLQKLSQSMKEDINSGNKDINSGNKDKNSGNNNTSKKKYDVSIDDSRNLSIQLIHQPGDDNKVYLFTHTNPSVRLEFDYNKNFNRLFSALDLLIRTIPENFDIQERELDDGGFVIERDGDIRLVMNDHGRTELKTKYSNGDWVRVGDIPTSSLILKK